MHATCLLTGCSFAAILFLLMLCPVTAGAQPRHDNPARIGRSDGRPFDVNSWQRIAQPSETARAHKDRAVVDKPRHNANFNEDYKDHHQDQGSNSESPTKTVSVVHVTKVNDQGIVTETLSQTSMSGDSGSSDSSESITTSTAIATTTRTKAAFVPPNVLSDATAIYQRLYDWTLVVLIGLGALSVGFASVSC